MVKMKSKKVEVEDYTYQLRKYLDKGQELARDATFKKALNNQKPWIDEGFQHDSLSIIGDREEHMDHEIIQYHIKQKYQWKSCQEIYRQRAGSQVNIY